MNKATRFLVLAAVLVFSATLAQAADISLPKPVTEGGKGVLTVINNRASSLQNQFPLGAISKEDMSTLLWAASGRNRDGKGWTVPMAMARDPYCGVYLADANGVFRYNAKAHSLTEVTKDNIIPNITSQSFATKAPAVLILVMEGDKLAAFSDPARRDSFGYILIGAMAEHIYLAAESLGIGTRYMATLNAALIRDKLKLKAGDTPVAIMPLGHK